MFPDMRTIARLLVVALLLTGGSISAEAKSRATGGEWIASWAASQQVPEPQNSLNPDDLHDATLRQIVHLTVGGSRLRVHISNAFGTMPMHLTSVHIAQPVSPAEAKINAATDKPLTFSGKPDVSIPAGAEFISDAIDYPMPALSDLAITLHLDQPPTQQTGHPGSRATSYLQHGDAVSAADMPDAKKIEHWYWIAGVDANASKNSAAIVVLGDSITDGHGATTNGNDRWTDVLVKKLQANPKTRNISVLNHGIGGNHLLTDGLGPNALARVDRDILAQPGVRYLIVLEGINDLGKLSRDGPDTPEGHHALVQQMIAAYEQIILRAHDHGIKAYGATILPDVGSGYYHPGPSNEADRVAVNQWIRQSGHFDAVIDFDKLTADPVHPDHMLPAFDGGDHLHPGPAGYKAMGESIPLSLFQR
jgi:lysophospholipase L1-like esterase